MKKRLVLLISLLILVCLITFIAYSNYVKTKEALTGETVTGEATDSNFAISITIAIETPNVTIVYPENETYITTKNLWLNYSESYAYAVWYNIDSGTNTTLTGNITFNTTEGQRILYLYGNNTGGINASDNVTFTINSSKFRVIYNEYAGSTKGSSIDFNKSSYENLQNLGNIVLENTAWGKIQFYGGINVTNDSNFSDYETDLDTNTNISENRIELNPTALPNFNKPATLYLYNLNFSNPRILKDGSVCSSTICTEIDYSVGGTLIFNVTQFTVYSAEETPVVTPTPPVSGGAGGGMKSFSVDVNQISVKLNQGEIETRNVIIKNNLNRQMNITISSKKIADFILIKDPMIILGPGESKSIPIDFIARIDDIPDLYLGEIILKENMVEEEILVTLEIESKDMLLDVYAEIPSTSKRVLPGKNLSAEIMILNLEESKTARDIKIEYKIRDLDGNDIFEEEGIITIETQLEFIKSIQIPENTEYGDYILYVRAIYNGEVASASAGFEVVKSKLTLIEKIFIALAILMIAIILFLSKKKKKKRREEKGLGDYKRKISRRIERNKK